MSRADEFRKNADECRPAGARSRDPLDKEHWPKIVQDGRGGRSATGRRPMTSDCERTERLQVMLTTEELKAVDEFSRFEHRPPSRAAAVRELTRRELLPATGDDANQH